MATLTASGTFTDRGISATDETERLWEQLLQFIEEKRVIPVVGQDLLTTTLGGQTQPLYTYLAERLRDRLRVPAEDAAPTLSGVACRYLALGGDLEDVYSTLKSVMPQAEQLTIPDPLLKLAELPFQLFVSMTFDNLLERALNQVRFQGRPKADVHAYSPQAASDLPTNGRSLDPAVFQLFGRLSAVPDYAVTDEDVLEFMHALQSETRRPNVLFDALNRSDVLVIGSTFSGWLARFFFRIAKRERLCMARGKTDFVADRRVEEDTGLVFFLNHFRTRTKVFPGEAVAFVNELHRRWFERHPVGTTVSLGQTATGVEETAVMPPGAVFLSYASEDLERAIKIRDALEHAGVDVWFDKQELQPGDDYEAKIRKNIDQCSLFVPVISRHTLTLEPRFFRLEWAQALKVAEQMPPQRRFISPVAVDDTPASDDGMPELFRKVQWTRLPDGQPSTEMVAAFRQIYRQYNMATASAA
jgi:TIR domain